jgi:hypothetical protein
MGTSVLSSGIKLSGCEADHSAPSNFVVNNSWSCTSTLLYVCMACACLSSRDNCLIIRKATRKYCYFLRGCLVQDVPCIATITDLLCFPTWVLTISDLPQLSSSQPPVQWVPWVLSPGVKRGRNVMLTTHPHLVPRSWMSRSYTSSPLSASMACRGTALLFFLLLL